MNYIITVINAGETFYLRSTTWTSEIERATVYANHNDAIAAGKIHGPEYQKGL